MTVALQDLDAHEQPSEGMRAEWKNFTKISHETVLRDPRIDDPRKPLSENGFKTAGHISKSQIKEAFSSIAIDADIKEDAPLVHHPLLPGLLIAPNLVPENVQTRLVDLMVHRDLSNPTHQTNMHLHFDVPYPPGGASFFSLPPDGPLFTPKDPSIHKPLSPSQVLNKRLHWVTLGGQYDWTDRVYPNEKPPPFPEDIAAFLESLFPATEAQAAIVNFYSPGDTMMMHRDVSEEANRGLVSLSLGCDGLFMIAPSSAGNQEAESEYDGDKQYLLLRLRSGDAIYMTEESRYAWHGVPKVVKGTCPDFLAQWPADGQDAAYEEWRGWMRNKRINLNVRQMKD
ncbi:Alpha-ketoglutarate-dependent dioxygenase-like protein [Emericellopsis cladophorae]|uniref:mRNA N(6)-methyladenine demethylase n=1 Tax=Emericellopsis cladophorae TaxID=2686198 RepID=A0A9P9Y514_9HYPO|nr:Alpha-ketoglutarate-dependent dioxygenase-like protein [Emericellopsis cladophorae]KAI6783611.1 Alpha-ketoglutarate-dependent dioxygenase-like protein [Emericellopsis cladophorae]